MKRYLRGIPPSWTVFCISVGYVIAAARPNATLATIIRHLTAGWLN